MWCVLYLLSSCPGIFLNLHRVPVGMSLKDTLQELVDTPGVSGGEHAVRDLIETHVEEHADSVETDDLGNLIARTGSGEKTLMLAAHMDQIGWTVRRIDDNGFLRISKIGGMFETGSINQRVTIHTSEGDDVPGVIGMKPPHLYNDKSKLREVPEMNKLFIDIGADDEEDAADMGVRVGDYISYDRTLESLGNDLVTGPAFDDRVGCAVAIEALKRFDEDYELVVVFSVQEEVGTKGARTSTFRVNPDVALAIDVSMAGDVPTVEPDESTNSIGDGVGIDMVQAGGRGLITPETVKNWLIGTAEDGDHNYHRSLYDGGATDAASIYLVREGIPTGSLGVPTRNIHSPAEVVSLSDMEDTIDFLEDAFGTLEDHF